MAYHLTPELYSVEKAGATAIQNNGAEVFAKLFKEKGRIADENVVMLNYQSKNSVDGPWFAYNFVDIILDN